MMPGLDLDSAYKIFIISSAILGGLWRIGGRINKLISTVDESTNALSDIKGEISKLTSTLDEHIESNAKRLDSLEAKVDRNTSKIEAVMNLNGVGN